MTVRFLTSWNGYSAGDRATLSGPTEAALIVCGLARADYEQDDPSPKFPPNANEAAAVVGAARVSIGYDDLPPASQSSGSVYYLTDYSGVPVVSDGETWRPLPGVYVLSQKAEDGEVKTGTTSVMEAALWRIRGGWLGLNGSLELRAKGAYGASANTNQEIQFAWGPDAVIMASAQRGGTSNVIFDFYGRVTNKNSQTAQRGGKANAMGSPAATTGAFFDRTVDTSVDFDVRILFHTPSSSSDSMQLFEHQLVMTVID
jgi:hypothetical protein